MPGLPARGSSRLLPLLVAVLFVAASLVVGATTPAGAAGQDVSFSGGGWGHGIGMSQWGARGYAANGYSAHQILTHYYQGTAIAGAESPNPLRIGLRHDQSSLSGSTSEGGSVACDGAPAVPIPSGGWSYYPIGDGSGGVYGQFRRSDGAAALNCSGKITLAYLPGVLSLNGAHNYRHGTLELSVRPGTALVRAVAQIFSEGDNPAVDVYLYGLGEMPSSWPREALRTQAIAGRTYALEKVARLGQHRTSPACDCALVSTVFDQAYVGYDKETAPSGSLWVESVQSTRFLTVKHNGALIQAYYSSSSGGATENNELVWGGTPLPYLRGVGDPFDGTGGNPNFRWTVRFSWSQLEAKLNAASDTAVGSLQSIEIVSPTGTSGRVIPLQSDGSGGVRIVGSGGTRRVGGDRLRGVLGLKSTLFSISDIAPSDSKTVPVGGYALRADGGLVPFGSAPPATGVPNLMDSLGRAVALGGPSGRAGYVLDGYGGLHPVNGASATTPTGAFPGFDIARDLVLRSDGRSGYVLDGWGGIHPFGGAPAASASFYASGSDVARRLALRPDGTSGYAVLSNGAVHPFGGAPTVSSVSLTGTSAIGLLLGANGVSGFVADANGDLHPFAATGQPMPVPPNSGLDGAVGADGRADGTSGYFVAGTGSIAAFGGALPATTTSTAGAARRDIALVRGPLGYVLDGFGGLHPYGGAARPTTSGYWNGWDIARRIVVRSDGGGYVMDAYAGLHPFAQPGLSMPSPPSGGPYWSGWTIARDVVLLTDSSGYILDGFGGVHPFGGAPAVQASGYWRGWDIARRIALRPDGSGGYVLDGYGGLHPFAVGSNPMPRAVSGNGYWSGWDIARDIVLTGVTSGWTLDGFGGAHPFGDASGGGSWSWPGRDMVIGAATGMPSQGWVVYGDSWGGIHTAPGSAPAVDGSAAWPGWAIARDLAALPGA